MSQERSIFSLLRHRSVADALFPADKGPKTTHMASDILSDARFIGRQNGGVVAPEHLLIALAGRRSQQFADCDVQRLFVAFGIEQNILPCPNGPATKEVRYSDGVSRTIRAAERLAILVGSDRVTSNLLVAGLVDAGVLGDLFEKLNIDKRRLREMAVALPKTET